MPVTILTAEIILTSETGPEEAIGRAVAMTTGGLATVEHVEVKQVEVLLQDANVSGYRATLEVTYYLTRPSRRSGARSARFGSGHKATRRPTQSDRKRHRSRWDPSPSQCGSTRAALRGSAGRAYR